MILYFIYVITFHPTDQIKWKVRNHLIILLTLAIELELGKWINSFTGDTLETWSSQYGWLCPAEPRRIPKWTWVDRAWFREYAFFLRFFRSRIRAARLTIGRERVLMLNSSNEWGKLKVVGRGVWGYFSPSTNSLKRLWREGRERGSSSTYASTGWIGERHLGK